MACVEGPACTRGVVPDRLDVEASVRFTQDSFKTWLAGCRLRVSRSMILRWPSNSSAAGHPWSTTRTSPSIPGGFIGSRSWPRWRRRSPMILKRPIATSRYRTGTTWTLEGISRCALPSQKLRRALSGAAGMAVLPKTNFFMLMRDEALAQLRTRSDEQNDFFAIECDGETLLRTRITNGLCYGCEVRSAINGNALRRTS